MELAKKFLKLFEIQINTGIIDPEIPALFTGYQFLGLTKTDDKLCLELANTFFDYRNNKYVNCYRLFTQEDQLILIDRKYSTDSRTIQSNAIMLLGIPMKHDFEFTDDGSNLFNPDIKKIANHEKLIIYFDSKEGYQHLEPHLQGITDHYDRFNNSCEPMSFFSYPQMNLLGYHINGGLFEKEELDNIIKVMKELKHKGIDL